MPERECAEMRLFVCACGVFACARTGAGSGVDVVVGICVFYLLRGIF